MDGDDIVPWLKSDLLSGFSDLLDTEPNNLRMGSAATLGSSDLLSLPPPAMNMDLSSDQVSPERKSEIILTGALLLAQHCGRSSACAATNLLRSTQIKYLLAVGRERRFQVQRECLLIGPSPLHLAHVGPKSLSYVAGVQHCSSLS